MTESKHSLQELSSEKISPTCMCCTSYHKQEAQLPQRDRASTLCQLKSCQLRDPDHAHLGLVCHTKANASHGKPVHKI